MSVRTPSVARLCAGLAVALFLAPSALAAPDLPGAPETQPQPAPLADLSIYSLDVDPLEPDNEHPFRICTEIQNYGSGEPGPFTAAITLDGEEVASKRYTSFPPNGDTICGDTIGDIGRHNVVAAVDTDNEVAETSNDNNRREMRITITEPKRPDLTVNLTVSPSPPRRGETISLYARVSNVGAAASGNFTVNFTYDGKVVARRLIPSLPPHYSYPVGAALDADRLREGGHEVSVLADALKWVNETNELNNVDSFGFSLPRIPKPDLAAGNVTVPEVVRDGKAANFTIHVENLGDKGASAFVVRVLLDNRTSLLTQRLDQGLRALNGTDLEVVWPARAPGNHSIHVSVDDGDRIAEADESNNALDVPFVVLPRTDVPARADLVLDRLLVAPEFPLSSAPVNFTAVVRNAGTAGADRFLVAWTVDGAPIGSFSTIGIPPGASIAATARWSGAAGEHVVEVTLDAASKVPEANESNNVRALDFLVRDSAPVKPRPVTNGTDVPGGEETPPATPAGRDNATAATGRPDLRVQDVSALLTFKNRTTGKPDPRLVATLANQGTAIESRPFTIYYYVDGTLAGQRRWENAIRPEGTGQGRLALSIPFTPTVGAHQLRAVAIYDGQTVGQATAAQQVTGGFTVPAPKSFLPAPGVALAFAALAGLALVWRRRSR